MRKENTTIKTKFISEAGSYLKNADYFAFVELEDCACYCIADGIDTDREKESARLAVTAAIAAFQEKPKCSKRCLKSCIWAAHKELLRESKGIRLEVSLFIFITDYQYYRTVHAGNVREYLFRNGKQAEQSKDLSFSQILVENGELSKDKVEEHEERHNLYCYLGQPERFRPEYSRKKKLKDGDIFLFCTRGIWQHVGTAEFTDALEEAKEPGEVCSAIEEVILSRRLEQLDNYTIACIFIDKIYRDNGKRRKRILRVFIVVLVIFLLIGIILLIWYFRYCSNQKKIEKMIKQVEDGVEFFQEESYQRASREFTEALQLEEQISYHKLLNQDLDKLQRAVEELVLYDRMIQVILDGEEKMEKQDYVGAVSRYEKAKKLAREILDIEEDGIAQIQKLVDQAMEYLDILARFQSGEQEFFRENLDRALEEYQTAYELAVKCYAAEYKKEAMNRIKEVKAAISDQEKQDAEDKKEKEQEEEKKQKESLLIEAERQKNLGDAAYEEGQYEQAIAAYEKAVTYYTQAKEAGQLPEVESRMILAENKNTVLAKQRSQAEEYIQKAEEKQKLKDWQAAYILYELALEIYQEYGMKSEGEYIKQKMADIKAELEIETTTETLSETVPPETTENHTEEITKAEEESSL